MTVRPPTVAAAHRAASKAVSRTLIAADAAKAAVRGQIQPALGVLRREHTDIGKLADPLLGEVTTKVAKIQEDVAEASEQLYTVIHNTWFQDFIAPNRPLWVDTLLPAPIERLIDDVIRPEFYRAEYILDLLQNTGSLELTEHFASGWGSDRPKKYTFHGLGLFPAFYQITDTLRSSYDITSGLIGALEEANLPEGHPVVKMCRVGLPKIEPTGGRQIASSGSTRLWGRTFYKYEGLGEGPHSYQLYALTGVASKLVSEVDALASRSSSMVLLIRAIRQALQDYIAALNDIASSLQTLLDLDPTGEARSAIRRARRAMKDALKDVKKLQRTLKPIRRKIKVNAPKIQSGLRTLDSILTTVWSPCTLLYPIKVDAAASRDDQWVRMWAPGTVIGSPYLDPRHVYLDPTEGRGGGRTPEDVPADPGRGTEFGAVTTTANGQRRIFGLLPWQAVALGAGVWMLWPEKT